MFCDLVIPLVSAFDLGATTFSCLHDRGNIQRVTKLGAALLFLPLLLLPSLFLSHGTV